MLNGPVVIVLSFLYMGLLFAVAYWADGDRFNVIVMTNRADHPAEGGLVQDIIRLFPPESFAEDSGD